MNLNLVFGTALTAGILGGGMESTPGRKGIMFVGSQSGVLSASPLVAVYAAAKAGVASLAGSVASEFACRSVDIDVLCCTPGQTLSGSTLNWWGGDGWVPPYVVPSFFVKDVHQSELICLCLPCHALIHALASHVVQWC